mmetsp:Transcript_36265/g.76309  ORF Transcript_36265/g.76309 Transcript_36265/m.76309 type:complete len:465 (+) Transcript_36265:103-1497(+)
MLAAPSLHTTPTTTHLDERDFWKRAGPTQWIELFQKLKNLTGPVETRAWQVQTGETPCDAELRAPGISRSSAMMLKAKLSLMTRGDICLSRVTAESSRWASRDYTALQQELDHINLGGRSSRSFERRGRLSRTLGEPSRIPRILHQMAHGGGERGASVMLGATDWMERLHAQKHGWCVFYWSDAELAKLVHMYYPLLAPTYDALPLGVMRSDLARYLVVALYGGWYADTDIVCRDTLDHLERRSSEGLLLLRQPSKPEDLVTNVNISGVANFLFGSTANHPFWSAVMAEIFEMGGPVRAGRPPTNHRDVVARTGPGLLTRAARKAFRTPPGWDLDTSPFAKTAVHTAGPDPETIRSVFKDKRIHQKRWHGRMSSINADRGCVLCYHLNMFNWANDMLRANAANAAATANSASTAIATVARARGSPQSSGAVARGRSGRGKRRSKRQAAAGEEGEEAASRAGVTR